MQRLEVSGAVRPIYESLGVKRLIIAQGDTTQSNLFIILQVHSTCFGCQPHPLSGIRPTLYKMQRLEVSGAVRPIYESLGVKRLISNNLMH